MSVVIVGSIALDTVQTPVETHADMLGGSASYASVAASFFAPVKLVGVVGTDFPRKFTNLLRKRGIDLAGLQVAEGKTFRWAGVYEWDYNTRRTLSVALNVFEKFNPTLPANYATAPFVMLGNIHPSLQHRVLDQVRRPKFILADTMDLWIETARPDLMKLLKRVDALCLNDSEARQLTGETSLIKAGRALLRMGPKFAVIKKGEHGALLFSNGDFFSAPAYPLEDIHDPTGAGDCFAGALIGYVARAGRATPAVLRRAIVHGSVVASFNVESFSLNRLERLRNADISRRYAEFVRLSKFHAP
ncbi:MAG: PfkB family carbohydrate kinase [Verrucomicrobia bacterium]|nr:PfkB family carbohydrate kinase [Verrucomicrobiota bacterium]